MAENTNGTPLEGQPNGQLQPPAGTGNPTAPQAGEDPNKQTYTKDEYDRLKKNKHEADNEARNLRERLRALEEKQSQIDSAAQAAETERLKQQGEFQTLAEQRETELNQLKPQYQGLQGKYDELSKLAKSRLEAEVKDWPAKLKAKLPQGDSVDVLDMARAIDNFRDLAEDYSKQQAGAGRGSNGPGPTPAGIAATDVEKARQEHGRLYTNLY